MFEQAHKSTYGWKLVLQMLRKESLFSSTKVDPLLPAFRERVSGISEMMVYDMILLCSKEVSAIFYYTMERKVTVSVVDNLEQ